jgi:hypothetical protein
MIARAGATLIVIAALGFMADVSLAMVAAPMESMAHIYGHDGCCRQCHLPGRSASGTEKNVL